MTRLQGLTYLALPMSALVLTLAAAPLPFERANDGLIWLQDLKANRLLAYRPNGTLARDLDLPKDDPFLGLTPDGRKILYARGVAGRRTYHVRDIGVGTPGTDLGLDYSLFDSTPMWTRDGGKFIRVRGEDPKRRVGVRSSLHDYALFELQTKRVTPLDLHGHRWVIGWTPDEKGFITLAVGDSPDYGAMFVNRVGQEPTPLKLTGTRVWPNRVQGARDGRTLLVPGFTKDGAPKKNWHQGLWTADLVTGRLAEVVHEQGHGYTEACWSPDGKRLCLLWGYVKSDDSEGWDEKRLTVANADGTRRVTVPLDDKAKGQDPYRLGLIGWYPAPR